MKQAAFYAGNCKCVRTCAEASSRSLFERAKASAALSRDMVPKLEIALENRIGS